MSDTYRGGEAPRRRRGYLLLALALFAAGVALLAHRKDEPVPPLARQFSAAAMPERPGAPVQRRATTTPGSAPSPSYRTVITVDRLLEIAQTQSPKPLAGAVARAFLEQPELRGVYWKFIKAHGGAAPAAELIRELASMAQFGEVVNRFKDQPGFREAWLELASLPGMEEALTSRLTKAPGGGYAAAAGSTSGTAGAARAVIPVEAAGTPSREHVGAGPSASAAAVGAHAMFGPQAGDMVGGDAHNVSARLGALSAAGRASVIGGLSPSAFSQLPRGARARLESLCLEVGCMDEFACEDAGVMRECLAACRLAARAGSACLVMPRRRPGSPPVDMSRIPTEVPPAPAGILPPRPGAGVPGNRAAPFPASHRTSGPRATNEPVDAPLLWGESR